MTKEIAQSRKIIGLQRKKVELLPYNPAWQKLYQEEAKLLYSAIGKYILDIQHVGSTSIPGAKAKPIIDIAIGRIAYFLGIICGSIRKLLKSTTN